MSRIITMAALALATSTSFALAGGPAAIVADPVVIQPAAAVSSGGLGTAAVLGGIVLIALAVGLGDEDNNSTDSSGSQ